MKKLTVFVIFVLSVCSMWFTNNTALAQQKMPDQELLNNMEIMETVLDKLINPQKSHLNLFSSHTKGYYLMNYGIIFNVSYSLFNRGIVSINLDKRMKKNNNYILVDEENEEVTNDFDKEIEKLKNTLTKFFADWTPMLSNMKPDEKITVILDFNGFFPTVKNTYDYSAHQLIASVPVETITKYRKGRIAREDFKKKIDFDDVKTVDEDISILSNVIETSLKHPDKNAKFSWSGDVKGTYFKGYGVIFFTDLSFSTGAYRNAITFYNEALKKSKGRSFTIESTSSTPADQEKNVEKIEQKLIHLMSNYGQSLRSLQPNEWIEIAINFKGMHVMDKYSKSILKVQKKNIDDYKREKIKYDQFKNMVKIIYY